MSLENAVKEFLEWCIKEINIECSYGYDMGLVHGIQNSLSKFREILNRNGCEVKDARDSVIESLTKENLALRAKLSIAIEALEYYNTKEYKSERYGDRTLQYTAEEALDKIKEK